MQAGWGHGLLTPLVMCLEFVRGSTPHHSGGDGILKRITRRYYSKGLTRVPQEASPIAEDTPHFDSNGLLQNEGVITWTTVMADKRTLSLESLLAMTPVVNGVDLVGRAARQLFLSHVKSQANVRDTFFYGHERDRYEASIDPAWFDFEAFANIYVCQAVYQNKDEYNIYKMVDGEKIQDMLADFYRSPDWKKIGKPSHKIRQIPQLLYGLSLADRGSSKSRPSTPMINTALLLIHLAALAAHGSHREA